MRRSLELLKSRVPFPLVLVADRLGLLPRLATPGWPVTDKNVPDPFFIVGAGRSGNTLLRSMLVAGGELAIPPESYVLPRIIRKFHQFSWLSWESVASLLISEFESYKEFPTWGISLGPVRDQLLTIERKKRSLACLIDAIYRHYMVSTAPEALRWGDKTPINTLYLPLLLRVFPNAQFIHIVRDPRAVANSYMRSGLAPSVKLAASRWRRSVQIVNRQLVKPHRSVIEVRYEDLVRQPESTLVGVARFLGVRFHARMLDYWQAADSLGDVPAHNHHRNIGMPLKDSLVDAWKGHLKHGDVSRVDKMAGHWLGHYGYEPE